MAHFLHLRHQGGHPYDIFNMLSRNDGYYSLDLPTCPFIPLPRIFLSRCAPPLLTPSLVLFPQRSAYAAHDLLSFYSLVKMLSRKT